MQKTHIIEQALLLSLLISLSTCCIFPQKTDESGILILDYTPAEYINLIHAKEHCPGYNIPSSYYSPALGLSGAALRTALHKIIQSNHKNISYTPGVWYMAEEADTHPHDSSQVYLIYSEKAHPKVDRFTYKDFINELRGQNIDKWCREHIWPKSHGDFGTRQGPGTDSHHLRAVGRSENSRKNNKNLRDVDGPCTTDVYSYEPPLSAKGDVSRATFYMAVMWEMEVDNEGGRDDQARVGYLDSLLEWHDLDPVDPYEIRRNQIIYQKINYNRNPFIDHQELVQYVFGSKQHLKWYGRE
jgi:endonuclease I